MHGNTVRSHLFKPSPTQNNDIHRWLVLFRLSKHFIYLNTPWSHHVQISGFNSTSAIYNDLQQDFQVSPLQAETGGKDFCTQHLTINDQEEIVVLYVLQKGFKHWVPMCNLLNPFFLGLLSGRKDNLSCGLLHSTFTLLNFTLLNFTLNCFGFIVYTAIQQRIPTPSHLSHLELL